MKHSFLRSLVCAALAVVLALNAWGCGPAQTDEPQNEQEEIAMETISLNGQWEFYRDDTALGGKLRQDDELDGTPSLSGGEAVSATLHVPNPEQMFYSKLQLTMDFGTELVTADGELPTVYAKIGDGDEFSVDISDYTHNLKDTTHVIDVGLYGADLCEGNNTVTVRSNITSGPITLRSIDLCYYPVLMFRDTMRSITVPGVWETQLGEEYTNYNGVGWYLRSFDLPRLAKGQQYTLTLEAVDYYAEIWLNGRFITSHEDGYTPIVIDLAQYADFLQMHDNRLVVRVTDQDTASNATFPIKQTLAGFYHDSVGINFAGIWNDVYLTPRGQTRVVDMHVQTDIDTMAVTVQATLKNPVQAATVDATVTILDGDELLSSETIENISVEEARNVAIRSEQVIEHAALWEISSPKLYTVRVELYDGGTCVDTTQTPFGFTSIRAEEDKLIFNDRIIKINGILSWLGNWEQLSPRFDE